MTMGDVFQNKGRMGRIFFVLRRMARRWVRVTPLLQRAKSCKILRRACTSWNNAFFLGRQFCHSGPKVIRMFTFWYLFSFSVTEKNTGRYLCFRKRHNWNDPQEYLWSFAYLGRRRLWQVKNIFLPLPLFAYHRRKGSVGVRVIKLRTTRRLKGHSFLQGTSKTTPRNNE